MPDSFKPGDQWSDMTERERDLRERTEAMGDPWVLGYKFGQATIRSERDALREQLAAAQAVVEAARGWVAAEHAPLQDAELSARELYAAVKVLDQLRVNPPAEVSQ